MSNKAVADALKRVLADSYTLYIKTQNFHWNVTGPQFRSLHLLFEEQYTDLQAAVDVIAERIRAVGDVAPGGLAAFAKLTKITDAPATPPAAAAMLKSLAKDQDTIAAGLKALLKAGEKAGDDVTVDLATQRLTTHEKNRWMLQSSL